MTRVISTFAINNVNKLPMWPSVKAINVIKCML